MSRGFSISHPLISLEIALKELDQLHIHEEIIPNVAEELVDKILGDGLFKHPIIVDDKNLVVLDGMHRVAASRKIGFHYIPACLVDYDNVNIHVGCWYRLFKDLPDLNEALSIFEDLSLSVRSCSFEGSRRLVDERKAIASIFSRSSCYAVYGSAKDIKERYDIIKQIETELRRREHSMGYETEMDAREKVRSGEFSAGLVTPPVSKREVIESALAENLFSQKTTRHVIPARPMFINVPIGWLHGDMSVSEANTRLAAYLSSKKIELRPRGQILDRRYDEELYIFL